MPVVPHEKGPARDLYSMTVLLRFGIHQDEVSRLFLEAQLRIPSAQDVTAPSGFVDSNKSCFQVHVSFPSGSGDTLSLPQSSTVGELKIRAQTSFGKGFLRLVTQNGRALTDPMESLQSAGVEEGDHLTVVAQQPKVAATGAAFAVWFCGGDRIVTWGDPVCDSFVIQDYLKNVQQVQATTRAFAAILANGSVVTWGLALYGGESSPAVQDQLRNVRRIEATRSAFAAILFDESLVTWGDKFAGGDSFAVQHQLRNVKHVQATSCAFAAILADGSVVTWGDPECGGDSSAVQDQLRNVQQIYAASGAFAAMLASGSVVTWGNPRNGGDNSAVQDQLKNVQHIQATYGAFAASLADGSVVAWGNQEKGGDCSGIEDQVQYL